jgi:hypothetical protein
VVCPIPKSSTRYPLISRGKLIQHLLSGPQKSSRSSCQYSNFPGTQPTGRNTDFVCLLCGHRLGATDDSSPEGIFAPGSTVLLPIIYAALFISWMKTTVRGNSLLHAVYQIILTIHLRQGCQIQTKGVWSKFRLCQTNRKLTSADLMQCAHYIRLRSALQFLIGPIDRSLAQ